MIFDFTARIPNAEESDFPWVQLFPIHQGLLGHMFDVSGKDRRSEKTFDFDNGTINHRNRSFTGALRDRSRKRKKLLKQIKAQSIKLGYSILWLASVITVIN